MRKKCGMNAKEKKVLLAFNGVLAIGYISFLSAFTADHFKIKMLEPWVFDLSNQCAALTKRQTEIFEEDGCPQHLQVAQVNSSLYYSQEKVGGNSLDFVEILLLVVGFFIFVYYLILIVIFVPPKRLVGKFRKPGTTKQRD